MNNQPDERLSTLLDGELDHTERSSALDTLIKDDALRQRWERYHLISDAMKRNLPRAIDNQLASRVMDALQDEPTVLAPPKRTGSSLGQRMAGLAVAASVAAVAVLGVQFMYQEDNQGAAQQQMAKVPVRKDLIRPDVQLVQQPTHTHQQLKRFHPQLNKYLLDHNQQAARVVQGVMPYARIVTQPEIKRQQQR